MEKKEINGEDLLNKLFNVANGGLFGSMMLDTILKKSEGRELPKAKVFTFGPDGLKDVTEELLKSETKTAEAPEDNSVACVHCNGDGYLTCEKCEGQGHLVIHTKLGEKNEITECDECEGVGDTICPRCKGSGSELQAIEDEKMMQMAEALDDSIRGVFEALTHNTIIGPVKLVIEDIQYGESGIYVIPDIARKVLLLDEEFDAELNKLTEHFNSYPILIPEYFYTKKRK